MTRKEKKKLYRLLNNLRLLVVLLADRGLNENENRLWNEIQSSLEKWENIPDRKKKK